MKDVKPYREDFLKGYKERIRSEADAMHYIYLEWEPLAPLTKAYRNHHTLTEVLGMLRLIYVPSHRRCNILPVTFYVSW